MSRVADAPREFINGYKCPACKTESIGIPLDNTRRARAWVYWVAITDDLRIACANCGNDVPRENWTRAPRSD
jgi:hypothetical protein